jgi:ankyrin repeat protein
MNKVDDPYTKLSYALCGNASYDQIETLIEEEPQSISQPDPDGLLPLHVACKHSASLEIIMLLTSRFEMALKLVSEDDQLPLHLAIEAHASRKVIEFWSMPFHMLLIAEK